MPKLNIEVSNLIYDSLLGMIENTQYQSVEQYVTAIIQAITPIQYPFAKVYPSDDRYECGVETASDKFLVKIPKPPQDPNMAQLVRKLKKYDVLQKDLASALEISIPAISMYIKNTNPESQNKLKLLLEEKGEEYVFVSAFWCKLMRVGMEEFQKAGIEINEHTNSLALASYGYFSSYFENVIQPSLYYREFHNLYDGIHFDHGGNLKKLEEHLEDIINKVNEASGGDRFLRPKGSLF